MAKITVDYDKCVGAGQCVAVCPSNVYVLKSVDESGKLKGVPEASEDCILCMVCVSACPESAITVEEA